MINLNELSKQCLQIAKKRAQHGIKSDTFSVLKHCAGEVVEAMDAYDVYMYQIKRENYVSELADIIVCVLIVCNCVYLFY